MNIRQLDTSDIPRLTLIAQRGLEFDEINEALIREKTIGAHDRIPDLGLVAEVTGRAMGFVQGAMGKGSDNHTMAYIRMIVVDRAWRNKGVAAALLAQIEQKFRAHGAKTVSTMDCPQNYFMPGIDFRYTEAICFFQKHGYAFHRENHNLLCNISVEAYPDLNARIAALEKDNIEIRRASLGDEEEVFRLLADNWPGWRDEAVCAFTNNPVSLHIARYEGKTVAFSAFQGNNKSLSWFGPMGTLPILRGKGIGGILLQLCLCDLASHGWRTAIIPWVGPVRFYQRMCGARMDRCFWVYRKDI
ncbi:MAG: GNAT family N-acetyltransferase [Candidatus Sumerlaeota bacterium]|nr:GNAT family N-acetyltransferase [Candidatus Sumerlaeota bacterium]